MKKKIFTVATAHLDTCWLWTYEKTIKSFVPGTLKENFRLFEKFPDYKFNFEGSNRYEIMQEYYPEDFEIREDDTEEMVKIKQSIATLSPGERNIFLSYCENPNLTAFAKQLKVTPSLLRNYINNVKNKIKTKINIKT